MPPDGESVLVYYQGTYGFFGDVTGPHSYKYVVDRLPGELEKMQQENTPFSVMRYIHNGVDNYPPDMKISEIVRQWNEKWAYPKLIVGTNSMFFEELEKQCSDIRTFAGELPHTDYVVGALSTAKETTINRLTHDALARAEKLATIASFVGDSSYPARDIRKAYDDMLLYDEHTWGKDYPAGKPRIVGYAAKWAPESFERQHPPGPKRWRAALEWFDGFRTMRFIRERQKHLPPARLLETLRDSLGMPGADAADLLECLRNAEVTRTRGSQSAL